MRKCGGDKKKETANRTHVRENSRLCVIRNQPAAKKEPKCFPRDNNEWSNLLAVEIRSRVNWATIKLALKVFLE